MKWKSNLDTIKRSLERGLGRKPTSAEVRYAWLYWGNWSGKKRVPYKLNKARIERSNTTGM